MFCSSESQGAAELYGPIVTPQCAWGSYSSWGAVSRSSGWAFPSHWLCGSIHQEEITLPGCTMETGCLHVPQETRRDQPGLRVVSTDHSAGAGPERERGREGESLLRSPARITCFFKNKTRCNRNLRSGRGGLIQVQC
ncbi:calcineurin-like phosphoesterase domain-containing protein 1 [Platysternon megacephalum]|uniref:Calcineurin-like phosphoesterase domain-containing protein 1 n=1 Tax=Platysternon megacephalum TaxID=55544 RepID=A0A4D9EDU6_9SAUR|nr:calcineurin-like phosphoesterase domain-containing protein 1 [Platysternon megacephalum]